MKLRMRVHKEKRTTTEMGKQLPLSEGACGTSYVGQVSLEGRNHEVTAKSVKGLAKRINESIGDTGGKRIPEFSVEFVPEKEARDPAGTSNAVKVEKKVLSGHEIAAFFSAIEVFLMPST